MIRRIQPDEVAIMADAGRCFYEEAKLPGVFDREVFIRRMRQVTEGQGVIFGAFDTDGETPLFKGALAAVVCESPFTGAKMAVEMFWYILPEYRGGFDGMRLIKQYDLWCSVNNVDLGAMIHLETAMDGPSAVALKALYEGMGFKLVETNYLKEYRK